MSAPASAGRRVPRASAPTDAELVVAAQGGDARAFTQLVERHYALVCSFAWGLTGSMSQSEEAAQEAFMLAWRRLSRINEPDRFRSWILTITRNATRRAHRRERKVLPAAKSLSSRAEIPSPDPSPLDRAISQQEELVLWRALAAIPESYRVPLVLYYQEEKNLEEVARALDLTPGNARLRLFRGRRMLQERVLEMIESVLSRRAGGKPLHVDNIRLSAAPGANL